MSLRWLLGIGFLGLAACSPTMAPTAISPSLTLTAAPTKAVTPHPLKAALEAKLGWSCPADVAGQTLRVASWPDYVAPYTIRDFKALCGVKMDYKVYDSSDELLKWLNEGKLFDVIVPNSLSVLRLIQLDMLYPARRMQRASSDSTVFPATQVQIMNTENLDSDFLNFAFDPENRYTTPYAWGTTGILYNTKVLDAPIETWDQFFSHPGPVAWLDESRMVMNIALAMKGFKPNSTHPDEINAARDYLLAHVDNVVMIDAYKELRDALQNNEIDMTMEYNGDALLLASLCNCDTYKYILLPDGSTIWIDNMAIPTNAPNKHLGEIFISYILLPQVNADISNHTFYGSPNLASVEHGLIAPDILSNPLIYPSEETINALFFTLNLPEATEDLYTEAWSAVIAAVEANREQ